MTRLVLIDKATQSYSVYENRVCLAQFVVDQDTEVPISKEEVEEVRVASYPDRA